MNNPKPWPKSCTLLKADQVAEMLAVDKSTVWRLTQRVDNPLPVVRFGERNTRFRLSDVEAFLNGGRDGR